MTIHNAPEDWNWQKLFLNKKTPTIYCSQSSQKTNPQRNCIQIVIENGIPQRVVDNSAQQVFDKLKQQYDAKFILSVGRLVTQKNYKLLVEVARQSYEKKMIFLVCGDKGNCYEENLKSFTETQNIEYLGVLKSDEILSLMSKCDCFVNVSLHEGLPITVLEAFSVGLPCVIAPILPHYEIGTDMPYCYIPESFDAKAFRDCIEKSCEHGSV